jgi:hypothetical protein
MGVLITNKAVCLCVENGGFKDFWGQRAKVHISASTVSKGAAL